MSALIIAGIEIHQDQDGRFSLNDFHRAAGGEKRHAPNEWMRIGQAKELAEEIGKAGIPGLRTARGGRAPGTYACKELVYAYAMWISPTFSLHVIRTFDSVAANDQHIPQEKRLPVAADNLDAARRIAELFGLEGNQALLSANSMVKSAIGVDLMEMAGVKRLVNESQELNFTPTELGAKFGMSAVGMNKLLADCGLQRQVICKPGKKRWEVTPDGKLFAVITDTGKKHSDGKPVQQVLWKESVQEMLKRLADKLRAESTSVVIGGSRS
ncbi:MULTISPECIES: KilA-N domain-containing protein [unclassified Pseudomonas]|uniref:KilA-N domain-containing protein n=1 Tax=unclassified Pseudomonas TaxID=196821 RepID=UPI000D360191|nr:MULTISPECIES: KilA-N domain-containing protein [unclassified Pseudomonas]RAU43422.1 KilA-N domain-containing protein [Pseudomonas sp. RIT 409]RAU50041.1 KilA-N domain-containing protein [Pseudomonas sp. RIT 412]